MQTAPYVQHGKTVTDHLAPINAVMMIGTSIVVPAMDFVRPHFPIIGYASVVVVLAFIGLLAIKTAGHRLNVAVPTGLVLCAGLCAAVFSAGAIASNRHAENGGFIAAKSDDAKALQASFLKLAAQTSEMSTKLDRQADTLKEIRDGKSEDPRVELQRMGLNWTTADFQSSSQRGDLRALELFLKGGMPLTISDHTTLAALVVHQNFPNAVEQLGLFKKYGYDLNSRSLANPSAHPSEPPTLYALAREKGHQNLASVLEGMGAQPNDYLKWKKTAPPKGNTSNSYMF